MTSPIADTRAQVAPRAKAGVGLEAVRAKVDLSAHAGHLVGEDPWQRRGFQRYWTEPFVTNAYKDATGQPVGQGEEEKPLRIGSAGPSARPDFAPMSTRTVRSTDILL